MADFLDMTHSLALACVGEFYRCCEVGFEGYEFTGEFRDPRKGEWFLSDLGVPLLRRYEWSTYPRRLILRKIVRKFEFDGQTFECPKGFEFVRVGVLKESDVEAGHYIKLLPGNNNLTKVDTQNLPWLGPFYWSNDEKIPFYIFRKEKGQ